MSESYSGIPARILLHSILKQALEEDFWEGVKGAVWLYYENYTDAMDVEDENE